MELTNIPSFNITDLSQLIRFKQPLEVLNTERNQEDNEKVLNFVNTFMDVLDEELKIPRIYKEYVYGQKNLFVRSNMISRLELVASRIMEKQASQCSTTKLEDLNFIQEELNFVVDLYYLLVVSLIDLTAIRKLDLIKGEAYDQLFDVVEEHLKIIGNYKEMNLLMRELNERKDDYPELPYLQERIKGLVRLIPVIDGAFLFAHAKSVSDYAAGDVLVSIHPESDVEKVEIGKLPKGIELDLESGSLFVSDPKLLQAGRFNVLVKTSDSIGGSTNHHIKLPIGGTEIPKYEVAPFRVVQDYLPGDTLARPRVTEDVIPIAKAEWGEDSSELPKGVSLNLKTGIISVEDEDQLQIGVYPLAVILTSEMGSRSLHEFMLSFRQDKKAVYSFQPVKALKDYKAGNIIGTVADRDGKIIGAQKNALPSGLFIDKIGNVAIQDPKELKAGTYLFNVLTKSKSNVQEMKTLFITLDPAKNPFYYDTSSLKPIDDLKKGDKIAVLKSRDKTKASKVRLMRGELPRGTKLLTNGSLVVDNPSELEAANYDLRLTAFVDGIDPKTILKAEKNLTIVENKKAKMGAEIDSARTAIPPLELTLNEYYSQKRAKVNSLQNEIIEIEKLILLATGEELERLIRDRDALQTNLNELLGLFESEAGEQQEAIDNLYKLIELVETKIEKITYTITKLKSEIIGLKANRWIQYELGLLLTLEDDHPSAWHLEIPKDWDDYYNNEVIAQLVDCDGYKKVSIASGKLPDGLILNVEKGSIEVIDRNQLAAGEYVIKTKSIDLENGESEHRLALIIGGIVGDKEEEYILLPSKPANNYIENEILGYPFNKEYTIVAARISNGILPNGVTINQESGEIYVVDANKLLGGVYQGVVVKTTNSSGGINYHDITVSFTLKTIFTVMVSLPKPLREYKVGDKLIQVNASNGSMQGVQIVGGELAPGTVLNSAAGHISVRDTESLVAGDFEIDLFMIEQNGAQDRKKIQYSIGNTETFDQVNWNILSPLNMNGIKEREPIAVPSIDNRSIVQATSENIPTGMFLNPGTGKISVRGMNLLTEGTYDIDIDIYDDLQRNYAESIQVIVVKEVSDIENVTINVAESLDFHIIRIGDVLSSLSNESGLNGVSLKEGFLPEGTTLNSTTGRLLVADRIGLVRSEKTIKLEIHFTGANSIELPLVIKNKPIPNFSKVNAIQSFLFGGTKRMRRLSKLDRKTRLVTGTFHSAADKFIALLIRQLKIPKTNKFYLNGAREAAILKSYTSLTFNLVSKIVETNNVSQKDALIRIYNELFVTFTALSLYRMKDISSRENNPIAKMYRNMRGDLGQIQNGTDAQYVIENGEMIFGKSNPKFKYLRFRLETLVS